VQIAIRQLQAGCKETHAENPSSRGSDPCDSTIEAFQTGTDRTVAGLNQHRDQAPSARGLYLVRLTFRAADRFKAEKMRMPRFCHRDCHPLYLLFRSSEVKSSPRLQINIYIEEAVRHLYAPVMKRIGNEAQFKFENGGRLVIHDMNEEK
jgi:hypothetical protein